MASDNPPLDDRVIRAEVRPTETGYHVRDGIAEPRSGSGGGGTWPMTPPLVIVLAPVMIGLFIWTVISLRKHHRATLLAAERWRGRPTMGDGEFLMQCEIPDEPLRKSV